MGVPSKSDFRRVDKYVSLPAMTSRTSRRILACVLCVYAAVFFMLAWRRFQFFGHDTRDFGFYDNMFWWTLRGRPFFVTPMNYCNFGAHAEFLWLQLLPAYWLAPGVATLILLQTVFLTAAAIPVYLIAREKLRDERLAILLATIFLFLPGIGSQNVNQVEAPSFFALYLLLAFYFFLKARFGWFTLFALLACLGRENVALSVAMFGVWAAVARRPCRWTWAPVIGGATYFFVVLFLVMPAFRGLAVWHGTKFFGYLGQNPGEIVTNAITHPAAVLRNLFSRWNLRLVLLLFGPMLFLPLASPASLIALPDLSLFLLAEPPVLKVVQYHYNVLTSCALFVGAILALSKTDRWRRPLIWAMAAATLAAVPVWLRPSEYRPRPNQDALVHALQLVPPDRSVLVPLRLGGHVAQRAHWGHLLLLRDRPEYAAQFEYVILDTREDRYPQIVQPGWDDRNYELLSAEDGVCVYRRRSGEGDWTIGPDWVR
jgi:uncharacterized membrane protein